jgi:hypothetical protein
VPQYTLYFFDKAHRSTGFMDFESKDTAAAMRVLEEHRTGRAVELWVGQRRILWLPADATRG